MLTKRALGAATFCLAASRAFHTPTRLKPGRPLEAKPPFLKDIFDQRAFATESKMNDLNYLRKEPFSKLEVGSHQRKKKIDNKTYHVITVYGRVLIPDSYEKVLSFVKNMDNLKLYEPKLYNVKHLNEPDPSKKDPKGYYLSTGVFIFIPFRDRFSYVDRPDGFHSEMESGLLKGHMNGGFKVKRISDNVTQVYHYEVYEFTGWKAILPKFKENFLVAAMNKEMRSLALEYDKSLT